MLECQPQGALAAHADAQKAHCTRAELPVLFHERQHISQEMLLGGQLGIELQTNAVSPPATLTVRACADKMQFVEKAGEGSLAHQRFQAAAVKVENAQPRSRWAGRIIEIHFLAGYVNGCPTASHIAASSTWLAAGCTAIRVLRTDSSRV